MLYTLLIPLCPDSLRAQHAGLLQWTSQSVSPGSWAPGWKRVSPRRNARKLPWKAMPQNWLNARIHVGFETLRAVSFISKTCGSENTANDIPLKDQHGDQLPTLFRVLFIRSREENKGGLKVTPKVEPRLSQGRWASLSVSAGLTLNLPIHCRGWQWQRQWRKYHLLHKMAVRIRWTSTLASKRVSAALTKALKPRWL